MVSDRKRVYPQRHRHYCQNEEDTLKLLGDEEMRLAFGVKGREQALTRYGSKSFRNISFYGQVPK